MYKKQLSADMSFTQLEELKCPSCGEFFVAELWGTVNVMTDPDLKEALLGGVLNVQSCPKCGHIFYAERFILYHDPSTELMAFVYPQSFSPGLDEVSRREEWYNRMMKDFTDAQSDINNDEKIPYKPELFFGLDSLCRLIRAEEELKDEEEVVDYECRARKIKVLKLSPSKARQRKVYLSKNDYEEGFSTYVDVPDEIENFALIPRIIPLKLSSDSDNTESHSSFQDVIDALDKLISNNPALRRYTLFREALKSISERNFEKIISSF